MRILKNRWFDKFARKRKIADAALVEAVARAESGLIDADLGGGVLKQRIAREGEGKSGGFRSIIVVRSGVRAVFVYGFAKNDRGNISKDELAGFRELAVALLGATDAETDHAVSISRLVEVSNGENL